MKKALSLTIGIPTYYGGYSLVETVKSIRANHDWGSSPIMVCVDGVPLKKPIEKALLKLDVQIIFSKQRGGQVARIKQMVRLTKTDVLVLAQDDVSLHPQALSQIMQAFSKDEALTMVAACELPTPPQTLFEKILESGYASALWIGERWNGSDNYLLPSGRCLAFRSEQIKKFFLPEEIINSDTYLYFENKRHQGKCLYMREAIVYNPLPQKLNEHVKQSRKFAISQKENQRYFDHDLSSEYAVPTDLKIKALLRALVKNPIYLSCYMAINVYTRIVGRNMYAHATRFWDTDVSTKRVNNN